MKNPKQTNDKQRYYPVRDPENTHKVTLAPITEEQYRALYPEIWRIRKPGAALRQVHVPLPLHLEMRRRLHQLRVPRGRRPHVAGSATPGRRRNHRRLHPGRQAFHRGRLRGRGSAGSTSSPASASSTRTQTASSRCASTIRRSQTARSRKPSVARSARSPTR